MTIFQKTAIGGHPEILADFCAIVIVKMHDREMTEKKYVQRRGKDV